MDNFNEVDHLGIDDVAKVASGVKGLINKAIWNKKVKEVQKISDAGGYMTLSAHQKGMISMPAYAMKQAADQKVEPKVIQEAPPLPVTPAQEKGQIKKYMPFIIGAVVVAVIVFFVIKKK